MQGSGEIKKQEPKVRFQIGDKVQHEKFGEGVVDQVLGSGNKQLVNIAFENGGKKLLDPNYAKLIRIE
jgi:hypothetical protein